MHRPGEGGGVATDFGAVVVQQRAAGDRVGDVAAGNVPQVGVLGGDAQQRGRAAADEDRWVRSPERLGVAEGAGEPDVGESATIARTLRAVSTTPTRGTRRVAPDTARSSSDS